jgi:hypothetical protein
MAVMWLFLALLEITEKLHPLFDRRDTKMKKRMSNFCQFHMFEIQYSNISYAFTFCTAISIPILKKIMVHYYDDSTQVKSA